VSRRQLLPAVGFVAIALLTALAVVGISSYGDDGESSVVTALPDDIDPGQARPPTTGLPESGIEARGSLQPRIILFGDTIKAHVDVLLDRRKVDPSTVRVSTEFLPWEIVGPQARIRRDSGRNTYLRTTFTLRCTSSPCLPPNTSSALEFTVARLSYAAVGAAPGARRTIAVDWPILVVYSRFAAANAEGSTGSSVAPWRIDLDSFPAATYGLAPGLLLPALFVLVALLAAAAVVLAWVAIPRRSQAPEPEPEPEPEPLPTRTPLELALELLEDAGRADGAEDRRRALELVAEVLDLDHPDLARAARTLAWSEHDPVVGQTSGLATRVRTTIDLSENGSENGNGRVH
jgi:hypothetical protein